MSEDIATLDRDRRFWLKAVLSAGPTDREAAESALRSAYWTAGLREPNEIVWCQGPLQIETDYTRVRHERLGRNVKDRIFYQPQGYASGFLRSRIGHGRESVLVRTLRPKTIDPIGDVMGRHIAFREPAFAALLRNIGDFRLFADRRPPWSTRRLNFWYGSLNQSSFAWLGSFFCAREKLGFERETECVAPLLRLAQLTAWIFPFENVCWIADRPAILHVDAEDRLHSASGPCLAYGDGSAWYAWKGVPLPRWVIEDSDYITAHLIESQQDTVLRRCLIEIMTPERYIKSSGAKCISEDQTGKLWQRPWPDFGLHEGWSAVEVVNGTPEPDGSFKHYFLQVPFALRTARAAVAWTYGLSERDYAQLSYRT